MLPSGNRSRNRHPWIKRIRAIASDARWGPPAWTLIAVNVVLLLLLVIGKTILDLWFHLIEHQNRLASDTR